LESTRIQSGTSPQVGQPRIDRPASVAFARILVLLFTTGVVASCSTAPSWPTAQECRDYPDRCEGLTWQIAQDMKTLAKEPAPADSTLEDPSNLPRVSLQGTNPAYRIGPLDVLTITVWGARDIWFEVTDQSQQPTRVVMVQGDGTIVLPLLKNVHVSGLTLSEALAKIGKAYRNLDGSSFQVTGQISQFQSKPVLLDGAFKKPGPFYLSTAIRTLGEAVTGIGGGLTGVADASKGVLIRGGKRYRVDYRAAQRGNNDLQNIVLQAGDRVFFPSLAEVTDGLYYVFGEVTTQGAYPIPEKGVTLLEAVGTAKGPQQISADMDSIYLVRGVESQPKIFRLTLADMMTYPDIAVRPGDRFFVSATALADWFRAITQIMPGFYAPLYIYGVKEAFF